MKIPFIENLTINVGAYGNLRQRLHGMPCHAFDPRINADNFDYPKWTTEPRDDSDRYTKMFLFILNGDAIESEVRVAMESQGLVPVNFQTFIDFLSDTRSWEFGNLFVCLETMLGKEDSLCQGASLVPVMHQYLFNRMSNDPNLPIKNRYRRYMDLDRIGRVWASGTVFPALLSK